MKRTSALAIPLCLTLALAACSGGGSDASSDDGPVKLTFWHGYTEADGDVLDQMVKDFNASHGARRSEHHTTGWTATSGTNLQFPSPAIPCRHQSTNRT